MPTNLLCIPGAATSAVMFIKWRRLFKDTNIKVCPIEIPGRGLLYEKQSIQDEEALMEYLFQEMLPYMKTGKYMILANCFGGFLSYGIYKKIKEQELQKPLHIFITVCASPDHLHECNLLFENPQLEEVAIEMLCRFLPPEYFNDREYMEAFAAWYAKKLYKKEKPTLEQARKFEEKGFFNTEVSNVFTFVDKMIALFVMDEKMMHEHRPKNQTKIDTDLTVFYGTKDRLVDSGYVKAWKNYMEAGSQFHEIAIEGDHSMIQDASAEIVDEIRRVHEFKEKEI